MGRTLRERWRDRRFDREAFPELAVDVLREMRPQREVSEGDVLRWLAIADPLPPQEDLDARFGQPPITLYRDEAVSISALYWVDATTAIHQHSFCGAFGVLAGSSIHVTYSFENRDTINARLRLGQLRLRDVQRLEPGDVHPIGSGERFIHALFHLDRPTVSLVVRTHRDPGTEPQLNYLRPGLALDPFHRPPWLQRTQQVLRMMLQVDHSETRTVATEAVRRAGPFEAVELIRTADRLDPSHGLLRPLAEAARARYPDLIDAALPALLAEREQRLLVRRRQALHEADLRYLLALLLNVPTGDRILELVAARYPDVDPVRTVMGCIRQLRGRSLPAGNGTPANVLGVALDDADLWAVERMVRGHAEPEILRELEQGGEGVPEELTAARVKTLRFTLPFTSVFGPLLAR